MLHDVDVYHCQKCGRVENREYSRPAPRCCGTAMAVAVAHIRYESEQVAHVSTAEVIERSHNSSEANASN